MLVSLFSDILTLISNLTTHLTMTSKSLCHKEFRSFRTVPSKQISADFRAVFFIVETLKTPYIKSF
jgi:hypothetical protein